MLKGMLALLLLAGSAVAQAQSFCVFDILGAQGDLYDRMKSYAIAAHGWGVKLTVKPYADEQAAAAAYRAGQCDAVLLTGVRARQFNPFVGSIDSVGGLPGYVELRLLMQTLAKPDAAALMDNGGNEVGGVLPFGAAYIFLRDRKINTVEKLAGHKMAVLDYDQAMPRIAERIGAVPVSADVTTFSAKFNAGDVDAVVAPAVVYTPLELFHGVGTKGAVMKLPVAQITFQMILHKDKFPAGYGQKSRAYFLTQFDPYMQRVTDAEDSILFFYPPPDNDAAKYVQIMRDSRISLTLQGIYDPKMMALLKKIRCTVSPGNAECSDHLE
jgi:hypothetical protein